jgi:hypothetical protein
MASASDFPARGKILSIQDRQVVFAPVNTRYQIHLPAETDLTGAQAGVMIEALIRVSAMKIWTVASGGNFVAPIFGPPRTLQGRIRYLDAERMVLQCGVPIVVALPLDQSVYDLTNGPLALNQMANVAALPGATFDLLTRAAAKA